MLPHHATPAERASQINLRFASAAISELHARGITSPKAIAAKLTAQNVHTPRGGTLWTATAVRHVLARAA
jgi:recombinase